MVKNLAAVATCTLVIAVFAVSPAAADPNSSHERVVDRLTQLAREGVLDRQLAVAADHVTGDQGDQRFNEHTARAEVSHEIALLTGDIVAANNYMMSQITQGVRLTDIDLSSFKLVTALLEDPEIASAQAQRPLRMSSALPR